MKQWIIAVDGSGDYSSVQAAIDALPEGRTERVELLVRKGVYREKIIIPKGKPPIRMIGEGAEETVLSWGDYARMPGPDGRELGTGRTATLQILSDDFTMEHMTVENTAGHGRPVGQAVALYVLGDRQVFRHVRLLANQDTLYTGSGRHLYEECYIEGHVDYIFGAATCVFDRCEICSLRGGYITAASTPEGQEYGYVFLDCRLTAKEDEEIVYLGRPWRPFARTLFIRCWMGLHIKREGWDNWGKKDAEQTTRYGEYGSYGPGMQHADRVGWAVSVTEEEAQSLTVERILSGTDGWRP
ncbi:pectinesterase family protein [Gorillibacterium sp. sgz5001074]|uniref:pectinesterase family protein n=1 Tax=Gorillibacterium sp. sgz5001074 TaxID=3446695 RepID=UPI003F66363E